MVQLKDSEKDFLESRRLDQESVKPGVDFLRFLDRAVKEQYEKLYHKLLNSDERLDYNCQSCLLNFARRVWQKVEEKDLLGDRARSAGIAERENETPEVKIGAGSVVKGGKHDFPMTVREIKGKKAICDYFDEKNGQQTGTYQVASLHIFKEEN